MSRNRIRLAFLITILIGLIVLILMPKHDVYLPESKPEHSVNKKPLNINRYVVYTDIKTQNFKNRLQITDNKRDRQEYAYVQSFDAFIKNDPNFYFVIFVAFVFIILVVSLELLTPYRKWFSIIYNNKDKVDKYFKLLALTLTISIVVLMLLIALVKSNTTSYTEISKFLSPIINIFSEFLAYYQSPGEYQTLQILFMVPVIFSLIAITIILYARKKLIKYVIRLAKGEDPDPPKIRLQEFSQIVDAIDNLQSKLKGKKYIETFLSSIAHEVRTPLAGIKANTETLNLSMSSDEFIQSRNNILESNARMALIVDSLLDLAQLEQQNKTLKITKFNAQEAVKNILNNPDIDKKIKDKNIHVKTINLNVFLEGNQALIEMGLSNILNNAIDFSFKDKNISIKAMVIKGNTSIEVLDQGVGIPDNMINRIHNKFVSTPRPDTGRRSTGLGLSIVKIIMDLHNGAFKISNNPEGEGSIATLVFPGQSKHSN